jgi:hypothetical protein
LSPAATSIIDTMERNVTLEAKRALLHKDLASFAAAWR